MQKSTDYHVKKKKKVHHNETANSIHILSYRLLNNHIQFLYPRLGKLEKTLKQSRMPIPFEVYVASMVFFSMIAAVCGAIMGFVASQFINIQPASVGLILPLLTGLMLFGMTFGILQAIPAIRVKNRAAKLVEERYGTCSHATCNCNNTSLAHYAI